MSSNQASKFCSLQIPSKAPQYIGAFAFSYGVNYMIQAQTVHSNQDQNRGIAISRLISFLGVLIMFGSLINMLGCSTAKSGEGSVAKDGTKRDPSEILKIGEKAPGFVAKDHLGNEIKLSDYLGEKNVVLIFYPANETPGCTKQLCQARDDFDQYKQDDIVVFGVNPASAESHAKFAEKYEFPFGILVDTEGDIVRDYGCRAMMGLVKRTVYVIDKEGKIVFAERGMPSTEKQLASLDSDSDKLIIEN